MLRNRGNDKGNNDKQWRDDGVMTVMDTRSGRRVKRCTSTSEGLQYGRRTSRKTQSAPAARTGRQEASDKICEGATAAVFALAAVATALV